MTIDRQELPGAGHATQLDAAAVLEARARADDQVTHGTGDKDLARNGLATDSRGDVDGDAPDVGVEQFAFAGVDAGTDLMPIVSASMRNASAQRMACVGPSNVARWPSPVSSPPCRRIVA